MKGPTFTMQGAMAAGLHPGAIIVINDNHPYARAEHFIVAAIINDTKVLTRTEGFWSFIQFHIVFRVWSLRIRFYRLRKALRHK